MAFRAKSEQAYSGGNNSGAPQVAKPTGTAADDIVILTINMDATAATITGWPSGFTEIMNQQNGGPDGRTSGVAWKRAGGSEPSNYVVTMSGSTSADTLVTASAFSGRATGSDPEAGTTTNNNTNNADPVTVSANGVTAVDGDDLVFVVMLDATGSGALTSTAPSGYTTRIDSKAGFFSHTTVATKENASAGATGTVSGSVAGAGGGYDSVLIRIPVGSGASTYPVNIMVSRQGVAFASARNRF